MIIQLPSSNLVAIKQTLVLSSGKTIVLEDVANGKLTEELGTTIEKQKKN
jgi:hypothetical protein